MLPDISISIEEMNTKTFESIRGIASRQRVDASLYQSTGASGKSARAGGASKAAAAAGAGSAPEMAGAGEEAEAGGKSGKGADTMFYRITCRDNGCGMPHERIPDSACKERDSLACRTTPSFSQGSMYLLAHPVPAGSAGASARGIKVRRAPDAREIWPRRQDGSHLGEEVDRL